MYAIPPVPRATACPQEAPHIRCLRALVTIQPRVKRATIHVRVSNFVLFFPDDERQKLVAEIRRSGFRPLLGCEDVLVKNVPLEKAPRLASTLALVAAGYCSRSDLWLDDKGLPPPLVVYVDGEGYEIMPGCRRREMAQSPRLPQKHNRQVERRAETVA